MHIDTPAMQNITLGSHTAAGQLKQPFHSSCVGGPGTVPYEQNTQQWPF
jgi:hypothetical protein